jgi:hypothetical protein
VSSFETWLMSSIKCHVAWLHCHFQMSVVPLIVNQLVTPLSVHRLFYKKELLLTIQARFLMDFCPVVKNSYTHNAYSCE